ncbi:MAG: hypothetical protein GXP27_17565 [Planctomycetes bacterium]|nr:hypothetical protein [Planctomycetota bacterium]
MTSPQEQQTLTQELRQILAKAEANNTGTRAWRGFKLEQGRQLLELAARSPRMHVLDLSFDGDFNAVYTIRMPVPRWPVGERLRIGSECVFHVRYEEHWRWEAPPGWGPVGIVAPEDVFAPNLAPALRGAICLGRLPPGITVKDCTLLSYYVISMQQYSIDENDPLGVLNPIACEFFRRHPEYLPLTHAGLFEPWEPEDTPEQNPGDCDGRNE